jgi:hypothetical protein
MAKLREAARTVSSHSASEAECSVVPRVAQYIREGFFKASALLSQSGKTLAKCIVDFRGLLLLARARFERPDSNWGFPDAGEI